MAKRAEDICAPSILRIAALLASSISGTLLDAAVAAPPGTNPDSGSEALLSRGVVIPLKAVNGFFPDITQEMATGPDATASGSPRATRSVVYATPNTAKKITITVDRYQSSAAASWAFREAVRKSRAVPGFRPASVSKVGEQAFAGTVTQAGETHIGLGAIRGDLIIGLTLAGYTDAPDNIAKLLSLTREEETVARTVAGSASH
jgi:hypothetical protein